MMSRSSSRAGEIVISRSSSRAGGYRSDPEHEIEIQLQCIGGSREDDSGESHRGYSVEDDEIVVVEEQVLHCPGGELDNRQPYYAVPQSESRAHSRNGYKSDGSHGSTQESPMHPGKRDGGKREEHHGGYPGSRSARRMQQCQQQQQQQQQQTAETGAIRATAPMWRCSRIMHMQRDLHPTVLSSLEGKLDNDNMDNSPWINKFNNGITNTSLRITIHCRNRGPDGLVPGELV